MSVLFILLCPAFLLSADVNILESDFIERSINFAIFVAILWYLAAGKIIALLKDRRDSISNRLDDIQEKLRISKLKKDEAIKALEDSKNKAQSIINNANKEAEVIAKDMERQYEIDVKIINRNHQDLISFERKKMKRAVVSDVMDELLKNSSIDIDKSAYMRILLKGVS